MSQLDFPKPIIFYSLIGLFGLSCAAWLMVTSKNMANEPENQPPAQEHQQQSTNSLNNDNSTAEQGNQHSNDSSDSVGELTNVDDDPIPCSTSCNSDLAVLNELDNALSDESLRLDDENFYQMEAYVEDIAAYLQSDSNKLQDYIQIALTTSDGDKRAFLAEVFKHLPYQQKIEIGESFIGSENWRTRADGITLIANESIANPSATNTLIDVLSSEENAYVKGTVLAHLKHNPSLQGDSEFLQQLDSLIYSETDSSVRGEALKAKLHLSDKPSLVLSDAVQAVRDGEPEFQLAGLAAIEQILEYENKHTEADIDIDRHTIRNEIESILGISVHKGAEQHTEHVIKEARAIYLRYFES